MLPIEAVRRILRAALQNGGDLAEVYLENTQTLNLSLDDGRLENATTGNDIGGGIRVFYGDTAAYAYTDDLSEASLIEAAKTAASAVRGTNTDRIALDLTRSPSLVDFPIERPFNDMSIADKAAILLQMDLAARAFSPYVSQVLANFNQVGRHVLIYDSEGLWAQDDRHMLEFRTHITAQRGDVRQTMASPLPCL